MIKVCDTYLSRALLGDIGMHRKKPWEFLGWLITTFQGNKGRDRDGDGVRDEGFSKGDYTHCFIVTQLPEPDAEVKEVRPGFFEVKNPIIKKDSEGRIIYSSAGMKCHATYPRVIQESINWGETHFELWRPRNVSGEDVTKVIQWARSKIGRGYNLWQFVTIGLVAKLNEWVCSHFVFDAFYKTTQFKPHPVILSPEGKLDNLATVNDLVNSGKMYKIRYDGLLPL